MSRKDRRHLAKRGQNMKFIVIFAESDDDMITITMVGVWAGI